MKKRRIGSVLRPVLAAGCFIMAVLSFSGVASKESPNDQLMFGFLWTLAGLLWILRIWIERRRTK